MISSSSDPSESLRDEAFPESQEAPEDAARLLFADDHPLVLAGLESALTGDPGLYSLGAVQSCAALRKRLRKEPLPHLALLDVMLVDGPVFSLLDELAGRRELPPFAMLTSSRDWDHVNRAMRLGARGYLLKDERPAAVLDAIRRMLAGERVFPAGFGADPGVAELPEDLRRRFQKLTNREREILLHTARGYLNREIAELLGISVRTVENHRSSAAEKLGARSAVQLSSLAVQLRPLLEREG